MSCGFLKEEKFKDTMGIISKALEKSRQAKEAAKPVEEPAGIASTGKNAEKKPAKVADASSVGAFHTSQDDATVRRGHRIVEGSPPARIQEMPKQAGRLSPEASAPPAPHSPPADPKGEISSTSDKFHLDSDLVSLHAPASPEAELFRILRSKVLFPREGRPPRSIMVTSTTSGEGKSFVAANLAVNLAKNIDQHVLLIDCDLREPSVHNKFGFGMAHGLSEYLSNGTALQQVLLKTAIDKLTLLPAGTPPSNPAEILSSDKMEALIDELIARYDDRYLIIDAPPPLMVPDTGALIQKVDGILLVVNYGQTNFDLIDELIEQVGKEKIIGAVINRSKSRSFRRYIYKRYHSYGKYGR